MATARPTGPEAGRSSQAAAVVAQPDSLRFFVRGRPRSKGSPAILRNARTGKPFVRESPSEKSWEAAIKVLAQLEARRRGWRCVETGPVRVDLMFLLPRSGKRDGTPEELAAMKPQPDGDKCRRAVLDALERVIYRDDVQVVAGDTSKRVLEGEEPGVWITVGRVGA